MADVVVAERFWARVDRSGDCWLWTGARSSKGYGNITINWKVHLTHRLAYELAVGPIPRGLFVMHACDNQPCVNPAHLSVGTAKDNEADKQNKGRQKAAIRPETVEFVLAMREAGASYAVIAAQIGRSVESTKKIANRKARQMATAYGVDHG